MKNTSKNPFAQIPQVERLLSDEDIAPFSEELGRGLLARCVAHTLDDIRAAGKRGEAIPDARGCKNRVMSACQDLVRTKITGVINATGVVLHTNLGRSPLPEGVWDAAKKHGAEYSSIEFDLSDGKRGGRFQFLRQALCELTSAEDSLILNNNAAAVFLMLTALAQGKEVIVARGQQVQIGGGFRIPEILALAGCKLVEVGTTNITTIADITNAVNENTAMVLWVHTSNYSIRGFTQMPSLSEIKAALPSDVIFAVDQGSGNIDMNLSDEPTVPSVLADGADIVCFSGDKLFGSVQAGCVVGRQSLVARLASHQLMRTYRVGKAIAALMQASLISFLNGGMSAAKKAKHINPETLRIRSEALLKKLPQHTRKHFTIVESPFSLGGGSTPDQHFPSWAIQSTDIKNAEVHKERLRKMNPPIIAIITQGFLTLHLITVKSEDDGIIAEALEKLFSDTQKGA